MDNSLFLLAMICFVGMVSPGPDFLLVTKNSLVYSKPLALATAFGIVTGCLFHASYCILGLAFIITQSAMLFLLVKYAGACYLMYLGWKGLTSKKTEKTALPEGSGTHITVFKTYLDGFLCNVLNPKLAVFLLSLFTQFVSVDATMGDKAVVAGVFVGESALYWPLLVMVLQSHFIRRLFDNFQIALNRICGALLVYLGVRVLLSTD